MRYKLNFKYYLDDVQKVKNGSSFVRDALHAHVHEKFIHWNCISDEE